MAGKRPDGDGMIRKRKDGYWEGRIVAGHKADGRPIFKSAFARTQSELLPKLEQLKSKYAGTELSEESSMTLREWLKRWLDDYGRTLRPSTQEHYRSDLEHHVLPVLGEKKISQITAVQVQKLYNSLHESGLSDSTVRGIHMVLHEAMEAAGHAHLIAVNPTDGAVLPKKPKPEKQVLNDEQLERFLLAIQNDPVWHDFFYTEITTGLRRGEICGLQWRDFDERTGRLSVRRSVSFAHGEKEEDRLSRLRISEPKTETSVRSILLPPSTADLLRKRKAAMGEIPANSPGWIFPDPFAAGQEIPVVPAAAYRRLKAILKKAELPDISFHALRHTFATHALSSGVDAKTLSGILGHTQASFTLDTYTHVTTDMQKRASDTVGGFMEAMLGARLKPWEKG